MSKAASPSQPMINPCGDCVHRDKVYRVIEDPSSPTNSLRYELKLLDVPGRVIEPIIHCDVHLDSSIHAPAAFCRCGKCELSLIAITVPSAKSCNRRLISSDASNESGSSKN